jgi:hypothetical protein
MPCYDKKLEASRQDFYNDLYQTRDVDCVITSGMRASATVLMGSVPQGHAKFCQCSFFHFSCYVSAIWIGSPNPAEAADSSF